MTIKIPQKRQPGASGNVQKQKTPDLCEVRRPGKMTGKVNHDKLEELLTLSGVGRRPRSVLMQCWKASERTEQRDGMQFLI